MGEEDVYYSESNSLTMKNFARIFPKILFPFTHLYNEDSGRKLHKDYYVFSTPTVLVANADGTEKNELPVMIRLRRHLKSV